jgi:hypothetical protein
MSRTSPSKTVSKRKPADLRNNKGPAPAASKARSAKDTALRAKTDAVLTQELKDGRVRREVRSNYPPHLSTGLELLGLMTRTVSASLTLPIGMARCRTPSQAWSEQNKFLQGLATDCRTVTLRMMNAAFNAFPEQDPQAKSKKRQQAHLQR